MGELFKFWPQQATKIADFLCFYWFKNKSDERIELSCTHYWLCKLKNYLIKKLFRESFANNYD